MPLKDLLVIWQTLKKRISFPLFCELYFQETKLDHMVLCNPRSQCKCQQLTAQANPQVGNILLDSFTYEHFLLCQVRVLVVGGCVLWAAKCNNGSVSCGVRQRSVFDADSVEGNTMFLHDLTQVARWIIPDVYKRQYSLHKGLFLLLCVKLYYTLCPLQFISTLQLCPGSNNKGQSRVRQLPWWMRSKPASEPVTVSIEKRQSVAASLTLKAMSCCIQEFPILKLLTWDISPVLSKCSLCSSWPSTW